MPGQRTAQQLVNQVRYNLQLTATTQYRDGFSTDPDTSSTLIPILNFVNQAIMLLARSGLFQSTQTVSLSSGQYAYTAPSGVGRIFDCVHSGGGTLRSLRNGTNDDIASRNRTWRQDGGDPNVYMLMGSSIWVYPVPTGVGSLTLWGVTIPADLVNASDVPTDIPPHYHDAISHIAAMMLSASDAENPARASRLPFLLNLWEAAYADADAYVHARSLFSDGSQMTHRREGDT